MQIVDVLHTRQNLLDKEHIYGIFSQQHAVVL